MPSLAIKAVRPAILMAETDVERLSALALQMEPSSPLAANLLLDEIDRAQIVADREMPDDVVRMHSTVEFVDEAHGQTRVSVLTPVGAGLIGLRARQEIRWPDRDGHERSLKILKVVPPHG
jgi:regulator of nucleoside diphosphate kinase